ncbi:MAG: hypothetical protein AAFY46_12150 [Planctomycetota bacterium]
MWHPEHHIFSMGKEGLAAWCEQNSMPRFRAEQIASWIFEHGVDSPDDWTNLSKRDRDAARESLVVASGRVLSHQRATDGTQKLLVEWNDPARPEGAGLPVLGQPDRVDRQTECVMIPSLDVGSSEGIMTHSVCRSTRSG